MLPAIFWDLALCNPYMNQDFDGYAPAVRWYLARLIFEPEDGGNIFIRNIGSRTDYTVLYYII
jgi:hypothetical protein